MSHQSKLARRTFHAHENPRVKALEGLPLATFWQRVLGYWFDLLFAVVLWGPSEWMWRRFVLHEQVINMTFDFHEVGNIVTAVIYLGEKLDAVVKQRNKLGPANRANLIRALKADLETKLALIAKLEKGFTAPVTETGKGLPFTQAEITKAAMEQVAYWRKQGFPFHDKSETERGGILTHQFIRRERFLQSFSATGSPR